MVSSAISSFRGARPDIEELQRRGKNDRSESEDTWKIVQAIVGLARNLGMEVIAEGIENLMQLKMLQTLGCEYGQGYYFSKPMDPGAIEALMSHPLPWSLTFERNYYNVLPFAVGSK
jgi:EAL domain-containing protein (putative c-di-GMP-specific phosphodiesterase class I)